MDQPDARAHIQALVHEWYKPNAAYLPSSKVAVSSSSDVAGAAAVVQASFMDDTPEKINQCELRRIGQFITPTYSILGTARIQCKQYELQKHSFSVLLYLGEVPETGTNVRATTSYCGSFDVWVNREMEACENCRANADLTVRGYVHLNAAIAKVSSLESFGAKVVAPYLKENLSWRVERVCRLLSTAVEQLS